MQGVDYAWERPDLDTLWQSGIRFVSRYLAYLPNGKVINKEELRVLHAKGFGVNFNWEQAQGDMLKGKSTGKAHATEWLRQANALGVPSHIPGYFSCDVDTTSNAQRAQAGAYLDGCAEVIGKPRVGLYGEYEVIEALVPTHATYGWQTYAWSGGKVSNKAHILQYQNNVMLGGARIDLDRSLKPEFGAWFPNNSNITTDLRSPTMMLGNVAGQAAIFVSWDGSSRQHLSGEQADTLTPLKAAGYNIVSFPSEADISAVMGPVGPATADITQAQLTALMNKPISQVVIPAELADALATVLTSNLEPVLRKLVREEIAARFLDAGTIDPDVAKGVL